MALQLGLRSSMSLATKATTRSSMQSTIGFGLSSQLQQTNNRWMSSKDAGDVIGIDLGTTNSCVAIMVSFIRHKMCTMCNMYVMTHLVMLTLYIHSLYIYNI